MNYYKRVRYYFICLLNTVLVMQALAHKEPTHQYIIREAYKFLKAKIGSIPEMEQHVGTTEGRCACNFSSPFMVGGAWAEDQNRVKYPFCRSIS